MIDLLQDMFKLIFAFHLIQNVWSSQGKTVIIVTHDPDVAKRTNRVIEIV